MYAFFPNLIPLLKVTYKCSACDLFDVRIQEFDKGFRFFLIDNREGEVVLDDEF